MAEQCEEQEIAEVPESEELDSNYKVPEKKAIGDIVGQDKDDESLERYKKMLLGQETVAGEKVEPVPSDKRHVIPLKLYLLVDGRPDIEMDIQDVSSGKKKKFCIKEGATYKMRLTFYVQREIVAGLRYKQTTYRKGIRVDSSSQMMGSYGPNMEPHVFTTASDEAPSGMLARGTYAVKSSFTDDDKNEYAKLEWQLDIKKDWED